MLTRQRETVEKQLAAASSTRTEAKWRWVAEYHNRFVQHWIPENPSLLLEAGKKRSISLL